MGCSIDNYISIDCLPLIIIKKLLTIYQGLILIGIFVFLLTFSHRSKKLQKVLAETQPAPWFLQIFRLRTYSSFI
jgi:hypothetical protein